MTCPYRQCRYNTADTAIPLSTLLGWPSSYCHITPLRSEMCNPDRIPPHTGRGMALTQRIQYGGEHLECCFRAWLYSGLYQFVNLGQWSNFTHRLHVRPGKAGHTIRHRVQVTTSAKQSSDGRPYNNPGRQTHLPPFLPLSLHRCPNVSSYHRCPLIALGIIAANRARRNIQGGVSIVVDVGKGRRAICSMTQSVGPEYCERAWVRSEDVDGDCKEG